MQSTLVKLQILLGSTALTCNGLSILKFGKLCCLRGAQPSGTWVRADAAASIAMQSEGDRHVGLLAVHAPE